MSGEGILQTIKTTLRGRKILCGRFTTATAALPTSQNGDGVAAYASTGTFTVTLPKKYGTMESVALSITGPQTVDATYDPATGVITIVTYTSGSAANTTGKIVGWIAVFSDRVS